MSPLVNAFSKVKINSRKVIYHINYLNWEYLYTILTRVFYALSMLGYFHFLLTRVFYAFSMLECFRMISFPNISFNSNNMRHLCFLLRFYTLFKCFLSITMTNVSEKEQQSKWGYLIGLHFGLRKFSLKLQIPYRIELF